MQPTLNKSIAGVVFATAAAVATLPNDARALVITNCDAVTTCTLDELVNQGRSIQIGDKTYGQWRIFHEDEPGFSPLVTNAVFPDLSQIEVEPTEVDPLLHRLRFDLGDQMVVHGGDSDSRLFLPLGYVVQTLNGAARIAGNTLELTEYSFAGDGGAVRVSQCDAVAGPIDGFALEACDGFNSVRARPDLFDLTDSTIFDPALPLLHAFTSFGLTSSAGDDGAQFSEFVVEWSQIPAEVPEPGTLAMFGIGLLGVAATRRHRKP